MERRTNEPVLMDGMMADLGDPKMMAQLQRLNDAVPWEELAEPVRATYANTTRQGGRPNVPVIIMIKLLFLQKIYNLSDSAMEGMLRDRISFRRFVGLGMSDPGVDETTIVQFRKRLREHGLVSVLFDRAIEHLRASGLIVKEGTLVDATIIEAPRGRGSRDGLDSTRDRAASYTRKNGRTYHGFKAHIATDTNGMVTDYIFDTAKVFDGRHMDQLIADEPHGGAVYADSAYMDKQRKERLHERGVFCGIVERRVRGQVKLRPEQQVHNRACAAIRARVEHAFAWIKNTGGFVRARYRGLSRNALDFALAAIAMNFKRSLTMRPV